MIKILKKLRFLTVLRSKFEKYYIVQMIISEVYKKRISNLRQTRYHNLFNLIKQQRSQIILEIGVFDGITAYKMIKVAKKFHPASNIEYYGFDLFEEISQEEIVKEVSKKPLAFNVIKSMLEKTGAKIHLYQGNTLETLPIFINKEEIRDKHFDFILIDGGHSIGTITSDWNNVKKLMNQNSLVIFDDYYTYKYNQIVGVGCNSLIANLDKNSYEVDILQPADTFVKEKDIVSINMIKVKLR